MAPDRPPADLTRWAEVLFPVPLGQDERIAVQWFWKTDWPNRPPAGRRNGTLACRDRAELVDHVRRYGTDRNLAVAFATVRADGASVSRASTAFLRTWSLAVDLDCGPGKPFPAIDSARARLALFESETGLTAGPVVATGTGLQAYYLLADPCADGGQVDRLLQALARRLDGDTGAGGRTRAMRPPGSRNFKYAPPASVRLLLAGERRFSIAQLEDAVAATPGSATHRSIRTARTQPRPARPRAQADVQRLLDGYIPPQPNGDRSARDWLAARELAEAGCNEQMIFERLSHSQLGDDARRRKHDADGYLKRTAAKAAARSQHDAGRA